MTMICPTKSHTRTEEPRNHAVCVRCARCAPPQNATHFRRARWMDRGISSIAHRPRCCQFYYLYISHKSHKLYAVTDWAVRDRARCTSSGVSETGENIRRTGIQNTTVIGGGSPRNYLHADRVTPPLSRVDGDPWLPALNQRIRQKINHIRRPCSSKADGPALIDQSIQLLTLARSVACDSLHEGI